MKAAKMGDPTDAATFYGPMARKDLREELHKQVKKTIKQGGRLILGGEITEGDSSYYPATVIADVKPGMTGFDEELFGPVACAIMATDEADERDPMQHLRYDAENDLLIYLPKNYPISLGSVNRPESLLAMMIHLSQKPWMTADQLGAVALWISEFKGFDLYGRKRAEEKVISRSNGKLIR